MAFDTYTNCNDKKVNETELDKNDGDIFNKVVLPKSGWANANPDAALAFIYITHIDGGMIDEILAA